MSKNPAPTVGCLMLSGQHGSRFLPSGRVVLSLASSQAHVILRTQFFTRPRSPFWLGGFPDLVDPQIGFLFATTAQLVEPRRSCGSLKSRRRKAAAWTREYVYLKGRSGGT